ncbi:hypothetical protein SAY86_007354 [Trapa natans]|uniref:Uncharacterized protein n=1 Tax=Trapa natans TaxID=22666 RepID=A0AAN7LL60_TRANT|nr:hypothetical protein SAY86_007354 [Trapa natans]
MALKQPFWLLLTAAALVFAATCAGNTPLKKEEGGEFEELKVGPAQAGEKAAEESESWTGWAKEKLSEGLGLKHSSGHEQSSRRASGEAGDAAKTAKDGDNDQVVVSGAAQHAAEMKETASEKGREAYEKASELKNSAGHTTERIDRAAKEKRGETTEEEGKLAQEAEKAEERVAKVSEEVKQSSEEAEEHVGWAKEKAKDDLKSGRGRDDEL